MFKYSRMFVFYLSEMYCFDNIMISVVVMSVH